MKIWNIQPQKELGTSPYLWFKSTWIIIRWPYKKVVEIWDLPHASEQGKQKQKRTREKENKRLSIKKQRTKRSGLKNCQSCVCSATHIVVISYHKIPTASTNFISSWQWVEVIMVWNSSHAYIQCPLQTVGRGHSGLKTKEQLHWSSITFHNMHGTDQQT